VAGVIVTSMEDDAGLTEGRAAVAHRTPSSVIETRGFLIAIRVLRYAFDHGKALPVLRGVLAVLRA
jgi:hypothetical protein